MKNLLKLYIIDFNLYVLGLSEDVLDNWNVSRLRTHISNCNTALQGRRPAIQWILEDLTTFDNKNKNKLDLILYFEVPTA
jgi:hypothetical protein